MKTIYEQIKGMNAEELAEWLYANVEWISAEFGVCSGADDSSRILEMLNSTDMEG
jgi:hypothetical protein